MKRCLADARITADAVDYINAHGTSTPLGDLAETIAMKSIFGGHASRLVISSTKNPKVASAARLRKRTFRDTDRRFLVEGAQGVREALAADPPAIDVLFVDDEVHELHGEGLVTYITDPSGLVFGVKQPPATDTML